MKGRIVGFGDFLLRLSPPGYVRIPQASSFEVYYTGAEANVCASLSVLGEQTAFVTRLPANPIAEAGLGELRRLGVDVSEVVRGGDRMGVYFLEKGASQRPSKVVYDRMSSGVTTARRDDFDWTRILKDASCFHLTGITPALGGELPRICADALAAAKAAGAVTVFDVSFRSALWTPETAARILPGLVDHADYLIAGAWDAREIFGVDGQAGLLHRFPNLKAVASTFRGEDTASDNELSAALFTQDGVYRTREYRIHLVDRVGGGDAFAAGLIYALGNRYSSQDAIDFALAAGCLKHTIEKDVNLSTVEEILSLVHGTGSGRVQR